MRRVNAKVDGNGRVCIPAEYRRELGLEAGDGVLIELQPGEVHIISHAEALQRLKDEVARRVGPDRSLADELIAERRAEAARE